MEEGEEGEEGDVDRLLLLDLEHFGSDMVNNATSQAVIDQEADDTIGLEFTIPLCELIEAQGLELTPIRSELIIQRIQQLNKEGVYGEGRPPAGNKIPIDHFGKCFDFCRSEDEKKKNPFDQKSMFFHQKQHGKEKNRGDETLGWRGLVYRAMDGDGSLYDVNKCVDPDVGSEMFKFLNMLINCPSTTQQEQIIEWHMTWVNKYVKELKPEMPVHPSRSINEVNRKLLTGTHSVFQNLPAQRVFDVAQHACVSLIETIFVMLGHGADFNFARKPCPNGGNDPVRNSEGLNGTAAAEKMVNDVVAALEQAEWTNEQIKSTYIGWIIPWSDAFLNSFVKQKDNSVHLTTATICPQENKKTSGLYTVVLAIGHSSWDHMPVYKYYREELDRLQKGIQCYWAKTNKFNYFAFSMIAWVCDRPEFQSITGTGKEGNNGKVASVAVDIDEKKLPACTECYRNTAMSCIGDKDVKVECEQCKDCCNWNVFDEKYFTKAPANYPGGKCRGGYPPAGRGPNLANLAAVRLNNEFMVKSSQYIFDQLKAGSMTKPQAEAYARTCNMTKKESDKVIESALERGRQSPYLYELWLSPTDLFDGHIHPAVPMHGVGHSLGPDTIALINSCLKQYGKMTDFYSYANKTIAVVSGFNLDYCKLKPLPVSAWVNENKLGFMRLVPYIYGMYLINRPFKNKITPHDDNVKQAMKCMLNAFQVYMSTLMHGGKGGKPPPHNVIQQHANLFMSAAHHLELLSRQTGAGDNNGKDGDEFERQNLSNKDLTKKLKSLNIIVLREVTKHLNLCHTCTENGKEVKLRKDSLIQNLVNSSRRVRVDGLRTLIGKDSNNHIAEMDNPALLVSIIKNMGHGAIFEKKVQPPAMCWNHGYWLTFVTNIADQIQHLGPLRLIW